MTTEKKIREPSYARPISFYRDPLESLIAAESQTCAGCAHRSFTLGREHCLKNRKFGRRCNLYAEAG